MENTERISSGVHGLDDVLRGGFVTGRMYLVCGRPGTGKTILGMHFLEEGLGRGETVLFVHGEESREEILTNAATIGIDITDAEFLDLGPESDFFTEDRAYDLLEPRDVDRERYTRDIHDAIRTIDPDRIVIDPITQLRYIEPNEHQFRKRILSLMRFLKERDTTVIATATVSSGGEYDTEIQSLSDGIVELSRGDGGRRLRVTKHRGFGQLSGDHGLEIRENGIGVFPAALPEGGGQPVHSQRLRSGIDTLDELVGGGVERGTVTFVSGPTGVGKTTLATQFLTHAASDGTNSAMYLFEEEIETVIHRSESIGMPVTELCEDGMLSIETVEPLALSAEEFAHTVRQDVERRDADVVLIDGINGYTTSIQGSKAALIQKLHRLTRHLKNRGVTVLITDEIPELTGITSATSSTVTYVADTIVFISYVETHDRLGKVIGVLKKRTSGYEHTLREFEITPSGVEVGEPLHGVTGVLQGVGQQRPNAAQDE